ncbi:MAG: SDR family NAD(P)-dependent oxidoreductase [Granulosicoccus sp.]
MSKAFIDAIMEKSVVPSFSSLGSRIRSRLFKWQSLDAYSLAGRVVVITGATSGIGEAGAQEYAKMGATLVIVARNRVKTDALIATLIKSSGNNDIHGVIADLGSQKDTRKAANEIATRWPVIDVLVHNAGALFNLRKYADNGTDLSVELMVATPFLLTGLLLANLKAASDDTCAEKRHVEPSAARVLTMSSGGMYTEALNVQQLQMSNSLYHGAKQYARAKRAQVILNELWANNISSKQVVFHALHPGWVNTPGITDALPGFSKVLNPLGLLRTPEEGADTMLWLSADPLALQNSGLFWHDRRVRDIDMANKTRLADTPALRDELWQWCEEHTRWQLHQSAK